MAYLTEEAKTLTTDNLLAGVVETFLQLRFATLAGQLPFQSTEFADNNWVVETAQPSGSSAQNPYSKQVASGTGGRHKVDEVTTGHLARDADTPVRDINAASNPNAARATYRASAAKKLAYDFEDEMVNGMGLAPHLHGIEYYLTRYGGFAQPDTSFTQINGSWPRFEHRKVFWSDSDASATDYRFPLDPTNSNHDKKPLSLRALDELITRDDGMEFDALATTRKTFNWIKDIYRLESGGNDLNIYKDDNFGQRLIDYEGIPIIQLDHSLEGQLGTGVGAEKYMTPAQNFGVTVSSGAGNVELTVNDPGENADARFKGFSDLDVGRTLTLDPDGSGSGPEEVTITAVKDRHTADVNNLDGSVSAFTNEDAVVHRTNCIYALKMDQDTGLSAMYNPFNNGSASAPANSGLQSLTGFRAMDKGELEEGRIKRDSFDWMGTFNSRSIWGIARLSHYGPPATT